MSGFDADDIDTYLPFMQDLELGLKMNDKMKGEKIDEAEQGLANQQAAGAPVGMGADALGGGGSNFPDQQGPGPIQGPDEAAGEAGTIGGPAV